MTKDNTRMKVISQFFPPKILEFIDKLVELGVVANRAEYIRNAVINQIRIDLLCNNLESKIQITAEFNKLVTNI